MNNLLPLESFRREIGYHPWHFWGLSNSSLVPVTSGCNDLVKQYAWQDTDAVGRSEIRAAIATAEQRLADYLGYFPAPHYAEKTLSWPRDNRTGFYRHTAMASDGRWLSLQLPEGQVQTVGIESYTLIGTAAVTYSDSDGDNLNDTFTLTIATTVTEPSEIAVYFTVADRLGPQTLSDEWRIQPVNVSIASGTATIRGRSYLLVKPVKYEGVAAAGLDPSDSANFVTQLTVYRRYTDVTGTTNATSQALLIWETTPCAGWWCCGSEASYTNNASSDPAALAYGIARAGIRDSRLGLVAPGPSAYNATSGVWATTSFATGYEPDRVTVRYLAGYPLVSGEMAPFLQTVVARLAAAELDRRICACETANRTLARWQEDLARTGGNNDAQYGAISATDLDNPLGTRRGQIYAWRFIRQHRLGQGLLM